MRTSFVFLLVLSSLYVFGQEGYKIDFKIKGLKDTSIYLGYYLQEQTFVKDTTHVARDGSFTFKGAKALPHGVYFLVLDKTSIFQMVVGHDQHFTMETSTVDYIGNMVVKGDEDNRLFFENIRFERESQKQVEPFIKVLQDSTLGEEEKKTARDNVNNISKKVMAYRQNIIDKYPATVTARILNMNRPVEIPDPPKKANGNIDSTFQFRYYRQHYFDHFPLGDEVMLRTSKVFYGEKVKDYLDKLIVQHPDSINKAIDQLVTIAKKNQNTYKYLVWNCLRDYQTPEIMGLDQVYVHLVDKYIASGEMDYWLDKKTVQNMKDYAGKIRRAPIGSIAANMIMRDENLQPRSMHDIKNKYTILFFFKPTCGHCREEAPKLVDLYKRSKKKLDFEVFAVATDTSMKEMKDFIKEFQTPWITVNGPRSYIKTHFSELYYAEMTPTIYITDEKKKIIARRLGVEQIEDFLINYEKANKAKASAVAP